MSSLSSVFNDARGPDAVFSTLGLPIWTDKKRCPVFCEVLIHPENQCSVPSGSTTEPL